MLSKNVWVLRYSLFDGIVFLLRKGLSGKKKETNYKFLRKD